MARGLVLRPDDSGCALVADAWVRLAATGLPSGPDPGNGLRVPHVSLIVAEHLDVHEVAGKLDGRSLAPSPMIAFEALGVFPNGLLHLVPRPDERLLEVQWLAYDASSAAPSTRGKWPYFEAGSWAPHMTIAYGLVPDQLGVAASALLPLLPFHMDGWTVWVEDGTTGEAWRM